MPRSKNEKSIIVIKVDNEISLYIYYISSNDGLRDLTKGGYFLNGNANLQGHKISH